MPTVQCRRHASIEVNLRGASKIDLTCATDPSPPVRSRVCTLPTRRSGWQTPGTRGSQVHAHNSTQRTPQSPPLPPDRRNENSRTVVRTAAPG